MQTQKRMKFAIVGAGVIAAFHAKAIVNHPRAELVAIADVDRDKALALQQPHDLDVPIYDDYLKMMKEESIDVVSVCVPSGQHAEVTIAAAEAGIHILCEKPLDITAESMSKMIEACRSANVKLGCVYQRRTLPQAVHAREAIQSGKLGKMVLGDAYLKYYRSPEYYRSAGWRGTWALDGGGALMNQGVHGVDLITWIMGDVDSVFAYAAPLVRDIEVEDTAVAAIRYKNGAFGVIQGTTSVYPGQETRFELHGEHGSIVFADSGIKTWSIEHSEEQAPEVAGEEGGSSNPTAISADGHTIFVDDIIKAIDEDREPLVSGEEARKAVDVILAIYESARTGKEVKL